MDASEVRTAIALSEKSIARIEKSLEQAMREIGSCRDRIARIEIAIGQSSTAHQYEQKFSTQNLNAYLDRLELAEQAMREIELLHRHHSRYEERFNLIFWFCGAIAIPVLLMIVEKFLNF